MPYTVKQFQSFIDDELRQNQNSHRTQIDDSMRKAKASEVINWINQGLMDLLGVNEMHWYRVQEFTPSLTSDSLELPYYLRKLDKIEIDDKWYDVGFHTTTDSYIWWDGRNNVTGNKVSFTEGSPIKLMGIFYPNEVVDEDSVIDLHPQFIRLLVLKILIYHSSRSNKRTELWYANMQKLERRFMKSTSIVNATGVVKPMIGF